MTKQDIERAVSLAFIKVFGGDPYTGQIPKWGKQKLKDAIKEAQHD